MDIHEDDIRKMHQFVCPEEINWNYAAPDAPRDGFVAFLLDNRGNGNYVRAGYTMEELIIKVQLKLIDQAIGIGAFQRQ